MFSITRKELREVFLDLQENVTIYHNEWYTIQTWIKIIYHFYDFGNGIDFLKKLSRKHFNLLDQFILQ